MLHTKFRENRPAGSGKKIFEWFLSYMGVAAIWSCDLDLGIKLSLPLPRDARHKISV